MSSPHIYHSALLLCPKESIVQRLYGLQVKPMARVIQGASTLWDPSIATVRFPGRICATIWSPCSRFIATAHKGSAEIVILDAATLEQLNTMQPHALQLHTMKSLGEQIEWKHITFSPDSHLLTGYSWLQDWILSWDLQTGGLLSNISTERCVIATQCCILGVEQ